MSRTALVISGGGSKGSFAVGAIKSIYNRFRDGGWFDIIGGCSTGALIAPLAALLAAPKPMSTNALKTMLYFYSHVTTSSVLEKNIFGIFQRHHSLNRSSPLNNLIHRIFIPECFDWLRSAEAPDCYAVYVNYQSGRKVFVSPRDDGMTLEKFISCLIASASVPVFIEPMMIEGDVCYDGGLRDIIPIGRAIELGAESVVPIFLDPDILEPSRDNFNKLTKILQRTMSIMIDETKQNDYEIAHLLNLGARTKAEILAILGANTGLQRQIKAVFERDENRELFGEDRRVVRMIDGLRPDWLLTDAPLSCDPALMKSWMELGERKANEIITVDPFG